MRVNTGLKSPEKVHFDKYDNVQLADILWGRAEAGLEFGTTTDDAIDHTADPAAGDARLAIALLRKAA